MQNLSDLVSLTPGVTLTDSGAEVGTRVNIRGVADNNFSGVPDVATFLDGVYIRDLQAINIQGVPLQRVEIVKGPVSATYGRDAYSGAINYVTERPTDVYHVDAIYTVGDHGREMGNFAVSGPILPGRLRVRIFGTDDNFDGTDRSVTTKIRAGDYLKKDGGAQIDVIWPKYLTTQINGYYGYDEFGNSDALAMTSNCGYSAVLGGFTRYCGRIKNSGGQVRYPDNPRAGSTGNTRQVFYGSMKNTIDLGSYGSISSVTGATEINENRFAPFDGTETGESYLLTNGQRADASAYYGFGSKYGTFSQELRYISPQTRRFRYSIGGYFFRETDITTSASGLSEQNLPAGTFFAPSQGFGLLATWATPYGSPGNANESWTHTSEKAGFVTAEYDIVKNVTFSTEYRYTDMLNQFRSILNQYTGLTPYPLGAAISQTNQSFNTRNSIRWQVRPNVMTYATIANGTRPGGFNGASTVLADEAYGPEKNISYEAGVKTTLDQNRILLNAAIFHTDTTNAQIYGPSSDPMSAALVVKNYGKTETSGVEFDAAFKPIPHLTLSGGLSYIDPEFDGNSYDYADAAYCATVTQCAGRLVTVAGKSAIPIDGSQTPFSSRWTLNASILYAAPLTNQINVFGRIDYRLQSAVYTDPTTLTSIGIRQNVNLNAGLGRGPYRLSLYIKNLTDDRTPEFFSYNTTLRYFTTYGNAVLPDGRTFGAMLEAHF